jgi:hypothetical protein
MWMDTNMEGRRKLETQMHKKLNFPTKCRRWLLHWRCFGFREHYLAFPFAADRLTMYLGAQLSKITMPNSGAGKIRRPAVAFPLAIMHLQPTAIEGSFRD